MPTAASTATPARAARSAGRHCLARMEEVWASSPREVLAVVARALRRGGAGPDEEAELRLWRARALWIVGSTARARAEVARAERRAQHERTRGRVERAYAELAWR